MKRQDLMHKLREVAAAEGLDLVESEGGSHTKVKIGDRQSVVPRHREINELTARAVLKQLTPTTEEN